MQLDIHTLLVAVALASAFSAAARILLWRMHPTVPGPAHWAVAGMLAPVALVLIITHGALPQQLSLSLAQIVIAIAFVLVWDGFRRFLGRTPLTRRVLAALAVATLVPVIVAHGIQSVPLRSISNALVIAVVSALIARELLSGNTQHRCAMQATGWVYAVNAVFFLARAFVAAQSEVAASPLNPDGLAAVPTLWWLCMTVATTLGMVLMTSERLQSSLDWQASRDPLTSALNRRAFSLIADKEIGRARRHGQPLSVLMMDLDHFKQINDYLGHSSGDAILCRFVATAERILRNEDVFCRFGGEEFVALLPSTAAGPALIAAERIRAAFAADAATVLIAPQPFDTTVSVGIAALQPGEDLDALLHRADAALYRAKGKGRNRCELAADKDERMGTSGTWQTVSQHVH
jgi:diguanylate cyclase (GGDEF)-like protein